MPEQQTSQQAIVGKWGKITRSVCSQPYPDRIHFQQDKLYFGQTEPPGMFTQWDVGTYVIVDPNQIKLSTANDAIITYRFSITDDVLSFVDPEGCEFNYRRSGN